MFSRLGGSTKGKDAFHGRGSRGGLDGGAERILCDGVHVTKFSEMQQKATCSLFQDPSTAICVRELEIASGVVS